MNISLFYQKEYFKGINFIIERKKESDFVLANGQKDEQSIKEWKNALKVNKDLVQSKNKKLLQTKYPLNTNLFFSKGDVVNTFCAKNHYPGFITGIGMKHETGVEGELKLGMYFDYTAGVPCIPASSVKGAIRSAFPQYHRKKYKYKNEKAYMISCMLNNSEPTPEGFKGFINDFNEKSRIEEIEEEIFGGKNFDSQKTDANGQKKDYLSVYEKDIFHDAFIVKYDSKGRLLGDDAITHHPSPTKNPNPVLFMKIMPGVEFQFNFDLKDGKHLNALQKKNLFEKIIACYGLGAKTNVGYGQFELLCANAKNGTSGDKGEEKPEKDNPQLKTNLSEKTEPANFIGKIKQGQELEAKIIDKVNRKAKIIVQGKEFVVQMGGSLPENGRVVKAKIGSIRGTNEIISVNLSSLI